MYFFVKNKDFYVSGLAVAPATWYNIYSIFTPKIAPPLYRLQKGRIYL